MGEKAPKDIAISPVDVNVNADKYKGILEGAGFKEDHAKHLSVISMEETQSDLISQDVIDGLRSDERKVSSQDKQEIKEAKETAKDMEKAWKSSMTSELVSHALIQEDKRFHVELSQSKSGEAWCVNVIDKRAGTEWELSTDKGFGFVSCIMKQPPNKGLPWKRDERAEEALRAGIAIAAEVVGDHMGDGGYPKRIVAQRYHQKMKPERYQAILSKVDLVNNMDNTSASIMVSDVDKGSLDGKIKDAIMAARIGEDTQKGRTEETEETKEAKDTKETGSMELQADNDLDREGPDTLDEICGPDIPGSDHQDHDLEQEDDLDVEAFFAARLSRLREENGLEQPQDHVREGKGLGPDREEGDR